MLIPFPLADFFMAGFFGAGEPVLEIVCLAPTDLACGLVGVEGLKGVLLFPDFAACGCRIDFLGVVVTGFERDAQDGSSFDGVLFPRGFCVFGSGSGAGLKRLE
jgi:hypothetical protein